MVTPGRLAALACLIALPAAPVGAEPEQLEQLEPEAGDWLVESFTVFDGAGTVEQEIELFHGVAPWLALGLEIEGEWEGGEGFEGAAFGLGAILTFIAPEDGRPGAGLALSAALDDDGRLAQLQARGIAEWKPEGWWLQANATLRHSGGDDPGALLAYGASAQAEIAGGVWLGLEASGQAFRLAGFSDEGFEPGHVLGPAFSVDLEPSGQTELEIGIAWLRRIGGDGPRDWGRLFVQLEF